MIEYTVIRSKRRTLSLEVKQTGEVVVRAPERITQKRIDEFVSSKQSWLERAIERNSMRRVPAIIATLSEEEKKAAKERAAEILGEKAMRFAEAMGLKYRNVKITSANKRFGSCSSSGNICFSYRLIYYPESAIDYVVIHELAHLRHMNHGKQFYALVEKYMPDYRSAEKILREY